MFVRNQNKRSIETALLCIESFQSAASRSCIITPNPNSRASSKDLKKNTHKGVKRPALRVPRNLG